MAVEDVFNPPTINKLNPKVSGEKKEGDKGYWEQKRDDARARLDYEEYMNAMHHLGEKPEAPFKVKGEIDLGSYNPQEQAKLSQERADKLIKDKDAEVKAERDRANSAEQKLQDEKLESIRQDFAHRLDELNKTIEKVGTAKDERPLHEQFKEQYTTLLDLAKEMGLEKTAAGRDPMVDIKLADMSYENARKEREFQVQLKENDRKWQLDLAELKDKREFRERELTETTRRNDMLFSTPATIGAAIAKGMAESAKGGETPSGDISQGQPSGPQTHKVRAGIGDKGEVECPFCHTMVGIGPDSVLVNCVGCNSKFDIERIPAKEEKPE